MAIYELSGKILREVDGYGGLTSEQKTIKQHIEDLRKELHCIIIDGNQSSGGSGGSSGDGDLSEYVKIDQLQNEVMNVVSAEYSTIANLLDNGQIDNELSIIGGNADD